MENHQQSDRLSWGDTVFLNLEREGMPPRCRERLRV